MVLDTAKSPGLLIIFLAIALLATEFIWAMKLLRNAKVQSRRIRDELIPRKRK